MSDEKQSRLWGRILPCAICFCLALAAYLWTATRTVQGGDSGELALVGTLGGVAHPPGYPLFTLLARLAVHLPLGPTAFRIALVSALSGAGAVAILQLVCLRLTHSGAAAAGAALTFGLSPVAWRLAGIPEVFALHSLLASCVLLFSLRLRSMKGPRAIREAIALGLAGGLGLSNQLTIVWCAPVVLWAVARRRPGLPLVLGALVAGGLIGLLPYAAIPWFARHSGPGALAWGAPVTWPAFLNHVLRRQYGTFSLAHNSDGTLFHGAPVLDFLSRLPGNLAWVPFLLGLAGLARGLMRRPDFSLSLLASFLLAGPLFCALFNLPMDRIIAVAIEERFYVLPLLLLTPFVAEGIARLLWRMPRSLQWGATAVLTGALVWSHRTVADWRHDTIIERYAFSAVWPTEKDAVIVGTSDTWFSALRWVTQAQQIRPDVHYVDLNLIKQPWYADEVSREIPGFPRYAVSREPWEVTLLIAATGHPTYVLLWDGLQRDRIAVDPVGFVDRVVQPKTKPRPVMEVAADLLEATARLGVLDPRPFETLDISSQLARKMAGQRWLDLGKRIAGSGDMAVALQCRAEASRLFPPGG